MLPTNDEYQSSIAVALEFDSLTDTAGRKWVVNGSADGIVANTHGSESSFVGNGSQVSLTLSGDNSAFNIRGKDWMLDFWLYIVNPDQQQDLFSLGSNGSGGLGYFIRRPNAKTVDIVYYTDGYGSSGKVISLTAEENVFFANQWHYIEIHRANNLHILFVNGIKVASATSTEMPYYSDSQIPTILSLSWLEYASAFSGRIDDFRFTVGITRYVIKYIGIEMGQILIRDAAAGTAKIAGTTGNGNESGGSYLVRAYDRQSGKLLRATWSSDSGLFEFSGIDKERVYFLVMTDHTPDRNDDTFYNAVIEDNITP